MHCRVALAVAVAALRMPENNMGATDIGEHFGTYIAGKRSLCGRVAILAAESDTAARDETADCRQQRRRRADEQLAVGPACPRRDHALHERARQRRTILAQPVHLPIAGDEFCPNRHVATPRVRLYLVPPRSHRHAGGSTSPGRQNEAICLHATGNPLESGLSRRQSAVRSSDPDFRSVGHRRHFPQPLDRYGDRHRRRPEDPWRGIAGGRATGA